MSNTFSFEMEKGIVKNYEREILSSGKIEFLVHMGFIDEGDTEKIVYNHDGFETISSLCDVMGVKDVLDIMEKVLLRLLLTEEYFLDCNKLLLSCSSIYINKETRDIKLVYLPMASSESNVYYNLIQFSREISSRYASLDARIYLESFCSFVMQNLSFMSLINKLGAMKREACICGIK